MLFQLIISSLFAPRSARLPECFAFLCLHNVTQPTDQMDTGEKITSLMDVKIINRAASGRLHWHLLHPLHHPRWNDFTDVTLSRLCCRVYGTKAEVYDFDMMKTPAKITKTCFWSNRSAFWSKLHKKNGSFYLKKNEWITLRSLDLVLMLADRSDLHSRDVRHVILKLNLYPAFSRFLDTTAAQKSHDKTWY